MTDTINFFKKAWRCYFGKLRSVECVPFTFERRVVGRFIAKSSRNQFIYSIDLIVMACLLMIQMFGVVKCFHHTVSPFIQTRSIFYQRRHLHRFKIWRFVFICKGQKTDEGEQKSKKSREHKNRRERLRTSNCLFIYEWGRVKNSTLSRVKYELNRYENLRIKEKIYALSLPSLCLNYVTFKECIQSQSYQYLRRSGKKLDFYFW